MPVNHAAWPTANGTVCAEGEPLGHRPAAVVDELIAESRHAYLLKITMLGPLRHLGSPWWFSLRVPRSESGPHGEIHHSGLVERSATSGVNGGVPLPSPRVQQRASCPSPKKVNILRPERNGPSCPDRRFVPTPNAEPVSVSNAISSRPASVNSARTQGVRSGSRRCRVQITVPRGAMRCGSSRTVRRMSGALMLPKIPQTRTMLAGTAPEYAEVVEASPVTICRLVSPRP